MESFQFWDAECKLGLPCWLRIHLQCRRSRFNSWVGKFPWRREWQLIPVFLPGDSHGQRSLVGYTLWGHRVMTKHTCTNVDWNNYNSPWPWKTELQRTWWLEVRGAMQFFSALETIKISKCTQLRLETCHQETSYLLFILKGENSGEPWLSMWDFLCFVQ